MSSKSSGAKAKSKSSTKTNSISTKVVGISQEEVLKDYKIAFMSREASLIGRKEVMSGKAKFGIFGDGKEVAQVAMARAFKKGDWRSGYYRDQTFMFAVGATDIQKFFAQLFADTDLENEPASGGRQMNSHFATRYIDEEGQWYNQCMSYNSSADMSPTAGQMARSLGLAYASKLYRNNKDINEMNQFSINGNEVSFVTIGNASTSEGIFWETLNAAGVLKAPLAFNIWDDGYGISVPSAYQTTKESISEICDGFKPNKKGEGIDIYKAHGWDYPSLLEMYEKGVKKIRDTHTPALFHIVEMTQPQGHSTSGSHERYKDEKRMKFEQEKDCIKQMRQWMVQTGLASTEEIDELEKDAKIEVENARKNAWANFQNPIKEERKEATELLSSLLESSSFKTEIENEIKLLNRPPVASRKGIFSAIRRVLLLTASEKTSEKSALISWLDERKLDAKRMYNDHLYSQTPNSPLKVQEIEAEYSSSPEMAEGRTVINRYFDHLLKKDERVFVIGEDVGKLGGVNLEFEGLNEKFGELRVTDTGIREATILGQGIGAAMRGLRPVADIQYLDYLLYCFQLMSDDLASLRYRSAGGQASPVVVRTKGHRLEGIWHSGSPIGMILNGIRGIHVCVPRNSVQAVGMYNTLFKGDDPGLVIEVLNGYRAKEKVPENLEEFTLPLGKVETLKEGEHITVVTYGACVKVAEEAIEILEKVGISVELIDVQTLLPFDLSHDIAESVKKTNLVLFLDEDVEGGATAYMMKRVLEDQKAYEWLDGEPQTLSGKDNRPAYASDGDYFSKPSSEDIAEKIYQMVRERDPNSFPEIF